MLSALLLVLCYPNLILPSHGLPWLAPIALVPLLIALAWEPRPLWRFLLGEFAGIVYWFFICYWIQFVLEVHGGDGTLGWLGNICAVLCFEVAAPGAVLVCWPRCCSKTRYAIPAIAALWTGIERTHGTFGFAWLTLGNAGIDMPLPLRVAPFVGVYGISFVFRTDLRRWWLSDPPTRAPEHCTGWPSFPVCCCFPKLPARETPAETALVLQPNMPEEEQWTTASAAEERDHVIRESLDASRTKQSTDRHLAGKPGPAVLLSRSAVSPRSHAIGATTHAYFLFGTVAETPEGAPLNSAVLLRPDGAVGGPLRQNQPGSVRRVRAAVSSAS